MDRYEELPLLDEHTEHELPPGLEQRVRRLAQEHRLSLLHRRKGRYWLMDARPMALGEIYERLAAKTVAP